MEYNHQMHHISIVFEATCGTITRVKLYTAKRKIETSKTDEALTDEPGRIKVAGSHSRHFLKKK